MNHFASDDIEYEAHELAVVLDDFRQKHGDSPIMVATPASVASFACSASGGRIEYDFVSSIYKSGCGSLYLVPTCEKKPFREWTGQAPKLLGSNERITVSQLSELLKKCGEFSLTCIKGDCLFDPSSWRSVSKIAFDDEKNLILSTTSIP